MSPNRTHVVIDLGSAVHEMIRAELLETALSGRVAWFGMRLRTTFPGAAGGSAGIDRA